MTWSTEKINEIIHDLNNGSNIKQIIRDININHLLSDESNDIKFPFLISEKDGSPILKTPFLYFEYTDEEKQTLFEIKSDPCSLLKFFDLKFYDYQNVWLRYYHTKKFNLFVKSRQIGATTLSLISAIHYILTNIDKQIVFICRNSDDAIDKISLFLNLYEKNIPFYMKKGVTKINQFYFEFENGCRILFAPENKSLIGSSIDFLIIEDIYLMNENTMPVNIPLCKDRILISTLLSKDDSSWVNQIVNNQTSHNFNVKKFDWTCMTDRDANWVRQEMIHLGSIGEFVNEYCCGIITPETQSFIRDIKIDSIL